MENFFNFDGRTLTPEILVSIARFGVRVDLDPKCRAEMDATRRYIDSSWLSSDAPLMYAFNTGVGSLKNVRIQADAIVDFQTNLIRSHSAGTGERMPLEVVRAMMALRVNAFASNHSGVRTEIVDRLLAMLNHSIIPLISSKGSVGASGDLAPLAQMAGALLGMPESRVVYEGHELLASEAFFRAGMTATMSLEAKDATALINGATASLAYAVLAAYDARKLLETASVSLSMTLEALRGEISCFEDRVMLARPHRGQRRVAASLLRMLAGSRRCTEEARQIRLAGTPGIHSDEIGTAHVPPLAPRIQDVYSLRCAPQVHGPVLDALDYIDGILSTEMNSATDNPLIFPENEGYSIISCGHFHGQYIAQAMDILALVVTDLSAICDRRSARLVDPACNFGLPVNLVATRLGINTGFPTVQSMGTGLVLENMGLCSPASATSLPAKGNTEDHISNSCFAARRSRTVVENAQAVVAVELLLAAQALDLCEPELNGYELGCGTKVAWQFIREHVPATMGDDRWVHDDIERVLSLVVNGSLIDHISSICGEIIAAADSQIN